MSEFFNSDVVRAEMAEIAEMQQEVYSNIFKFPSLSKEDQLDHVDMLEELIEKQKIMYTRLSLSNDPQAKKMKEDILSSASMFGFPEGTDMNLMFNNINHMVSILRHKIDTNQFQMQNKKVHTSQI